MPRPAKAERKRYVDEDGLSLVFNNRVEEPGDAVMASTPKTSAEQLEAEILLVPDEYIPALVNIVHAFREGVIQKTFEEELKDSWRDAKAGNTSSIDTLWDGIEH